MPSTLRTELDREGFDWESGRILIQRGSESRGYGPPEELPLDAPELDTRWPNGSQGASLPRVFASDDQALYICFSDRRSSGMKRIAKKCDEYLLGAGPKHLPFPE